METGKFEDLLKLEQNSIIMYVGKYSLEIYEKRNPVSISFRQKKSRNGSISIDIFDYGRSNEWEHVAFSTGGKDPHFKQILFDLPSKEARKICTDSLIKKFIPKKFYNFLDNLNIDIIKTKLV